MKGRKDKNVIYAPSAQIRFSSLLTMTESYSLTDVVFVCLFVLNRTISIHRLLTYNKNNNAIPKINLSRI